MTVESAGVGEAKRALRTEVLDRRSRRGRADRRRLGYALAATALARPEVAGCVCAYAGVGSEPATIPLLDGLRAAGGTVLLPVLAANRTLDWATYRGVEHLLSGPFGLLQPAGARHGPEVVTSADLLLVPALAVDVSGGRLGRGGGYYDRLLARLAGPTGAGVDELSVWAVVYDDEVLPALPQEPHDLPVRGALTPGGFRPLPRA